MIALAHSLSQWRNARPLIEAALETGPGVETIADVEGMLERGQYHLFADGASAAVAEILNFARRKALCVVRGGGSLDHLLDKLEPRMSDFASANGCDLMMGTGRMGWKKASEKLGYSLAWITMYRNLK